MRRRNRGQGKRRKWNRGCFSSTQLIQFQESIYNYPPFYSGFSISASAPLPKSYLEKQLTSHGHIPFRAPVVDWNRCVGCGICAQNCPVGAIELIAEKANIDPQKCIRCKTCSAVCPHNAIIMI